MEGASSGATRGRIFFSATQRPASPPTRGQHGSGRRPNQARVPVARHDDRAPALDTYDTNDIHICPRYIRSAANVWADTLSRELDTEDWQLNPRIFEHLQHRWGPHTIDRFASMLNAQLPRFNARWRDPQCEDIDCMHLPDAAWQHENNYCNPPGSALPALAAKLA
jgi:hypothetical protein